MCGFAGFLSYSGSGDIGLLRKMSDSIIHRGPDDSGHELIQTRNASIGLAFRRLSIIDLSESGHQPMFSADRSVCVMLNGEIYNYKELKSELEKSGYVFKSGSDTEVVIASYLKFGIEACTSFVGMFAITLVDTKENKIFLLRDRAGIKPLFYSLHDDGIIFGSELKSFHVHPSFKPTINAGALHNFFYYGNIPAPHTIFKHTFKVEPGHFLVIDLEKRDCVSKKYWDAYDAFNKPVLKLSYNEALEETEKLMYSAFKYRMVSDVPVGVFLSGGYDSSAVAALLSNSVDRLNTFTIGFREPEYDESKHAEKVAGHLGTNHQTLDCTINDAIDIVPDLPFIYDEPFGDSSAIPTILVSRLARKKVAVALSADAGDELFGGYPRHIKSSGYINKMNTVPSALRNFAGALMNLAPNNPAISVADRIDKLKCLLKSKSVISSFHIINQTFTDSEIRRLTGSNHSALSSAFDEEVNFAGNNSVLSQLLGLEYKTYLVDDILQKVDRATMSVSLEGREPFLDHRLMEWVATLPDEFKIKDGVQKKILKDIVHRYIPRELMERPKMGFGVPISKWLRVELRDLLEELFSESNLKNVPFLNADSVLKLKEDYLNGKLEDFERIWFVFVFLQWYKKWM